MKRDIEHVVTSTAMFVIAFIVSSAPQSATSRHQPRRRERGPSIVWFGETAMLLGALVWTTNLYLTDVAFCAHLRLHMLTALTAIRPAPVSPEVVDLTALGVEGLLLVALVALAIRKRVRGRRAPQFMRPDSADRHSLN